MLKVGIIGTGVIFDLNVLGYLDNSDRQQAVQKMTAIPAQRLGLWDRGILRPGMKADICVFDPQTVIERADYAHPQEYPQGIQWVIVNGHATVGPTGHTGAQGGQVL